MALSAAFYSIHSPTNSPLSHSVFFNIFFFYGLLSALLVLSTIYLFMKVSLNPDIILCGWLGLMHQLTNSLWVLSSLLCVKTSSQCLPFCASHYPCVRLDCFVFRSGGRVRLCVQAIIFVCLGCLVFGEACSLPLSWGPYACASWLLQLAEYLPFSKLLCSCVSVALCKHQLAESTPVCKPFSLWV